MIRWSSVLDSTSSGSTCPRLFWASSSQKLMTVLTVMVGHIAG